MKKKLNRPYIVWVDVDDVLVIFRDMFNRYLRKTYKLKVKDKHIAKDWVYSDVLPKNHEFMDYFNALPENWTENQKVFAGAKKFIDEIRSMGFYVIFITSVPEKQVHYRLKNLAEHNLTYDEIYFTTKKKSFYAKPAINHFENHQNIKNILIDDRAANCVDFLENIPNMIKAVTLNVPFNSEEFKIKSKFGKRLDFSSKTADEMHKTLLKFLRGLK